MAGPGITAGNATAFQGVPLDPTAPTDGQVPVYSAATGKYAPGAGGGGSGNVTGPGSSTTGDIASFADTTGKVLADSGVLAASVVVGPSSVTSGHIATFNGTTGKIIQDGGAVNQPVAPTAAGSTKAITSAMSGGDVLLDTASGSVCTLPAATGSGARFRFIVTVVATSNAHIVKVHTHGEFFVGSIISEAPAGTANGCYTANGTDDTVSFNGPNNGHALGDWFEVSDIATGKWFVSGNSNAATSAVDPFSQTV